MDEKKIKVISAYDGRCGIDNTDMHLTRRWPARGAVVTFTQSQLEELMFDPAFQYMVENGMLYIDDMEVKKAIGLEAEDATEDTIILMDEKALERFWKNMPLAQFKVEIKRLTRPQITALAEYAIHHGNDSTIEKAEYLTEISGYHILRGIELEKQSQEA